MGVLLAEAQAPVTNHEDIIIEEDEGEEIAVRGLEKVAEERETGEMAGLLVAVPEGKKALGKGRKRKWWGRRMW